MDLVATPFPVKANDSKPKSTPKIKQTSKTMMGEPQICRQKRIFGSARSTKIPEKAVTEKPVIIKPRIVVPLRHAKSSRTAIKLVTEAKAIDKKASSPAFNKKNEAFPKGGAEKTSKNSNEKDCAEAQTPLESLFRTKSTVSATPYYSAVNCSKCRFDLFETSTNWVAQIKLAESVGKHFVPLEFFRLAFQSQAEPIRNLRIELKSYLSRHRYLSEQKEWREVALRKLVNMGAGEGVTSFRSLQDTPTWALATVCFVIISISIFIDHLIHLVCNCLKRHRHIALFEAAQKLKSGLMILGFMSLLLTVIQRRVAKICIPAKMAYSMTPCRKRVLAIEHMLKERRLGAADKTSVVGHCESQGKTSLISEEGMNQLSIFFFVLAVMQIVYSVLTMALARAKMRRWKSWEKETRTLEYQVANDPNRFRFTRQTTFGRRHTISCTHTSLELWTKCFFRQFFHSVAKVDYLTLRHGFISAHLSDKLYFNFQKYIERSLEDDFKVVVGIRPFMWIVVVIFMLLAVHGWQVYLWVSLLPPAIVLVLGTKMEVIVAKMALQLKEQNDITKGALLVQPNDDFFWFGHPKLILTLIHFTLFLNAFEVAFFIWVTSLAIMKIYIKIIIIRVVIAVTVQVVCSYITLPLYALVTQMGSEFKSAVLEEQIANVMKRWHSDVRKKRQKQQQDPSQLDRAHSPKTSSNSRTMDFPNATSLYREPTLAHISSISQLQGNPPNPIGGEVQLNLAAVSSTVVEILAQENDITQTR